MKLDDTREGLTHRVVINRTPHVCPHCGKPVEDSKVKLFITANRFRDGKLAEVFVNADDSGSTFDGFADCWAIAVSLALQSGIPLSKLVAKFSFQDFEPKGMTDNPDIRNARSVVDYIIRWLEKEFGDPK